MLFDVRNKFPAGVVLFLAAVLFYFIPNHYPIFEPQLLPMSWIDDVTPFLPWTVWIYQSEFILLFMVFLGIKDPENFNKYVYSFFMVQFVGGVVFTFWPTTYPRDLFPLPEGLNSATHWLFSVVRTADAPGNCAPSLHVSSCYISAFLHLAENRKRFPFVFSWATLVGISTLTTKQHYLIDVILGLLLAVVMYVVFYKLTRYQGARGAHAKR